MRIQLLLLFLPLSLCTCIPEFDNPSDPKSDDYTRKSYAVVECLTDGKIHAGDTVQFKGGTPSQPVNDAELVISYGWDFDGDNRIDTTTDNGDPISTVYTADGTYHCRLFLKDEAGFVDTAEISIRIYEKTIPDTGDTTDTTNIGTDSITIITNVGDTLRVKADTGDSITIVSVRGDTVTLLITPDDTIAVTLPPNDTISPVPDSIYLPTFPTIPGFPDMEQGECAFFAEDSSLMRTTLNFYDIMWEQTRSDGLEAVEFIEKLVLDIIGYPLITMANNDYSYSFNNGVYRFTSGDFTIACSFHYGTASGLHEENDTVPADIFVLSSYISDLSVSLTSPYYTFTEGPLFDLINGDLSIDRSLNVSFSVDLTKLKISFVRSATHRFGTLPFYIVNDSIRLETVHTSFARMAPVPLLEFDERYHNDSIIIDHSGSAMESEPAALEILYREDDTYHSAEYTFTIRQHMKVQQSAYGKANDVLKLNGSYSAEAALGFNGFTQRMWFTGTYSTAEHDTSRFFCDESKKLLFGTLSFGDTNPEAGEFLSEKYDYSFPYTPYRISLEDYYSTGK